jgi:ribosomal protein S18 acetylase RimI-like enzyme
MQAALEKAHAMGLTRVQLTVREGNTRATQLYKKYGFTVEGLKRNAVRTDGIYENIICIPHW